MDLSRRSRQSHGFALAAVLWLMAGLSIVVALVADAAKTSAERVAQLRERTEFLQSALSGRAQAEYWLSGARPRTADFFDGAAVVMADNTPYRIDANSNISIQDHGGLINLNTVNNELLANFLVGCGVPVDRTAYLIDALADYIDSDNLQRLNGAERDTYTAGGKPPPRNSPLLSESEVWDVYGWDQYRARFELNGCEKSFTIYGEATMLGTSLNLATAPAPVLKAAGLNDELIRDIATAREDPVKVAERIAQNNALLGTGGIFGGAGGRQVQKVLRVTHSHPTGPWRMTYTLTLDSENDDRPWSISQPTMSAELATVGKLTPLPWPNQSPASTPSDASPLLPF
jgi:type II secretory pathway component PulK